jgi:hypothetical protein
MVAKPDTDLTIGDTPATDSAAPKDKNKWHIGRIFWGLLLIVIGGLVLADNFGIIDVNWKNVWRLWPLGIIAAGVSILSLRSWIWRALTVLLVALTIAIILFAAVTDSPRVESSPHRSTDAIIQQASSSIDEAEITIKAGLSDLKITTADQAAIADVNLKSAHTALTQKSITDGTTQRISFISETDNSVWLGSAKSLWDMKLTRSLPLALNIDTGASDVSIDVSQALLRTIAISTGASNVTLKLGDRVESTTVNLNAGASSVTTRIPKTSGVRLILDNELSSKQIVDLHEVDTDTYESANYHNAIKKIQFTGKIGASSLTIERY